MRRKYISSVTALLALGVLGLSACGSNDNAGSISQNDKNIAVGTPNGQENKGAQEADGTPEGLVGKKKPRLESCQPKVDIGFTVGRSGSNKPVGEDDLTVPRRIAGSASYTSCESNKIEKFELSIFRDGEVVEFIDFGRLPAGSQELSVDYFCADNTNTKHAFGTLVAATFEDGTLVQRDSNVIERRCE